MPIGHGCSDVGITGRDSSSDLDVSLSTEPVDNSVDSASCKRPDFPLVIADLLP